MERYRDQVFYERASDKTEHKNFSSYRTDTSEYCYLPGWHICREFCKTNDCGRRSEYRGIEETTDKRCELLHVTGNHNNATDDVCLYEPDSDEDTNEKNPRFYRFRDRYMPRMHPTSWLVVIHAPHYTPFCASLLLNVREKTHETSALDRLLDSTLLFGGEPRTLAVHDPSVRIDELLQEINVFIIDVPDVILCEYIRHMLERDVVGIYIIFRIIDARASILSGRIWLIGILLAATA